jgi:hypothetical protein
MNNILTKTPNLIVQVIKKSYLIIRLKLFLISCKMYYTLLFIMLIYDSLIKLKQFRTSLQMFIAQEIHGA